MSATQDHCRAVLAQAHAQNSPATRQAATDALRELSRPDLRDLIAKLAWTAGCLARRLPDDGVQVLSQLDAVGRHGRA